ncbi:vacuolar protein sorting-associated protein 54 [Chelonus insularis]|uniref:vacuolar protein sorting-associated protein 54 n=1 Tax=Chelonus insularis TaxID=460826 RepID=UPI001589CF20|nr:vacuolar protein sorting-associated protein 54 [Chelonus insularis]
MAKIIKLPDNNAVTITICEYCSNLSFKRVQDFVKHLREEHCSREGGSFVCHYGYNGVCSSLPLEGVSDKDYVAHANKHAVMQQQKKNNGEISDTLPPWTVYSAVQNLPAVLNDPKKGKQSNFLTKTWGESFVDKVDIPKSPFLPNISIHLFDSYLKKIGRRYRRYSRSNASTDTPSLYDLLNHRQKSKTSDFSTQNDFLNIPSIFFNSNLDLTNRKTFETIFPFTKDGLLNEGASNIVNHVKHHQEKLSQHLDIIEMRIAEQVASKSQAFFQAMTSHDVLMEQLTQTITVLKALRKNIHQIDQDFVIDSLNILRLEKARSNRLLVYEKLKLIATVHQSQPMIQLLLSTPDYVAALDLISTTQEILHQELNGIQSFRHLSSQLTEMEKLIDKMLFTEFQRYATADLNRPLIGNDNNVIDVDKLISIISGLLRQKHFQFIDTYKEESITTVRAVTKQRVIETLAASDCSDQQAAALEVSGLSLAERLTLLQGTIQSLTSLLFRIKAVYEVMKETINLSSDTISSEGGRKVNANSIIDRLLTEEESSRVNNKLSDMLMAICDYCHERLGQLILSSGTNEREKYYNDTKDLHYNSNDNVTNTISGNSSGKINEKESQQSNDENNSWLSDKATVLQVCQLANMVEEFTNTCELICGKQCTGLRSAFKVHASKFIQRFHTERRNKLSLLLEGENWKQADIPWDFQLLITYMHKNQSFPKDLYNNISHNERSKSNTIKNVIFVGDEEFAVVGVTLMLVQMIHEYCRIASELIVLSGTIGRYLAEILRLFNSRCCQLVLGAGAMQVAGLKTITSTILVLASRSLKLILWTMPFVRAHFHALANSNLIRGSAIGLMNSTSSSGGVALLDSVERDIRAHVREIEGKILNIVDNLVGGQINSWDARPPVPSQSFRNISRHLTKLYEAVSGILPPGDVQSLYRTVNMSFKEKLREQLIKMNIINNGGPQHGVVISELTFYLEALRNLKVLPAAELSDDWMLDVWIR